MEFLIIAKNKGATSDEVFHPLIDTAKLLAERAYLNPIRSVNGIYHEFQIGVFGPDSLNLVVYIHRPGSPDEMQLVIGENSNYFEISTSQKFDVKRLGIVKCDDDELLFRFCNTYLTLRKDHQFSYYGRHDKILNFENIVKIKYEPHWYENINEFI
jgi:hypothetical protein